MPIKASAATEIRALVDALAAEDDLQRETAIARLGVIGGRALERLTDAYTKTTERRARHAILRALEAIADHRSAPLARRALAEGGDVAVAAAGVLRALLTSRHAATAAAALDALVATALDSGLDRRLRLAALDALQEMPPDVRVRVAAALQDDPASGLRDVAGVITPNDGEAAGAEAVWRDAAEGRLPDRPDELRHALGTHSASAPPNTLRAMVDAVRVREREAGEAARHGWLALRGSLHQALALRGSRLGLYDLRESLEERSQLPASFLAALHVVGDVSCLEPLAAAWDAAGSDSAADSARWRHQLAAAFKAIVQREKITKRHAAMKRIAARGPGILT
jgi:hypothetical protein